MLVITHESSIATMLYHLHNILQCLSVKQPTSSSLTVYLEEYSQCQIATVFSLCTSDNDEILLKVGF